MTRQLSYVKVNHLIISESSWLPRIYFILVISTHICLLRIGCSKWTIATKGYWNHVKSKGGKCLGHYHSMYSKRFKKGSCWQHLRLTKMQRNRINKDEIDAYLDINRYFVRKGYFKETQKYMVSRKRTPPANLKLWNWRATFPYVS